jgi:hypothetical protein
MVDLNLVPLVQMFVRSRFYYHATRMWSPSWNPRGQTVAVVIDYAICLDFLGTQYRNGYKVDA